MQNNHKPHNAEVGMNALDIYNASVADARKIQKFIVDNKIPPINILGALIINLTIIDHEGKPIPAEFLSDIIKDFCAIRDANAG